MSKRTTTQPENKAPKYVYHVYATHETAGRIDKFDAIVERTAPIDSYEEMIRTKQAIVASNPPFTGLPPEAITLESLTFLHTKE